MLPTWFEIVKNPYGDITKDADGKDMFPDDVAGVVRKLAECIEEGCEKGLDGFTRNCAVVLLDPTAEASVASIDTIMLKMCIGSPAPHLLMEAAAKACNTRKNVIFGFTGFKSILSRGSGGFRGSSSPTGKHKVWSGTAGQGDSVNLQLSLQVEKDFSDAIRAAEAEWGARHPNFSWNDEHNRPHPMFQNVHSTTGQRFVVDEGGSALPFNS
ncbi:MAG TPA: hypothetical protein VFZ58_02710 [Candidatus Saccharimonadales bacterium]